MDRVTETQLQSTFVRVKSTTKGKVPRSETRVTTVSKRSTKCQGQV